MKAQIKSLSLLHWYIRNHNLLEFQEIISENHELFNYNEPFEGQVPIVSALFFLNKASCRRQHALTFRSADLNAGLDNPIKTNIDFYFIKNLLVI